MKKQSGMSDKDYQPSKKECAGKEMGKTNEYMSRHEKINTKAASKVRSQAYKGRYE